MAKFFLDGKWKKRTITALSVALSLSFSLGIFAACGKTTDEDDEDEDSSVTETDTQLLKNGDFEFYTGKTTEQDKKRTLIYSPSSWSFTSGSPTSDTASGIVNVKEWDYLTKEGRKFTSISDAVAHWNDEKVTVYDRLKFYDEFKDEIKELDSGSEAKKLFNKYNYSNDFEDVEKLREELGESLSTHPVKEDETVGDNMLMIHNSRTSDGVVGTAQYYTSSTTITLEAGTSAKLSVWVKTDKLTHYYSSSNDTPVEVTQNAGAYVGVTHTVGGTTLDPMQIKNINTDGEWQQYHMYVRANTFAKSTFKIVLGLGQGDTSNRYEQVNGYAFFDDLTCEVIPNAEYATATENLSEDYKCEIGDLKDDKIFDTDVKTSKTYALDLYAGFEKVKDFGIGNVSVALTQEFSGTRPYESLKKTVEDDIYAHHRYSELNALKADNRYLQNIFDQDFADKFPFVNADGTTNTNADIVMLLSAGGAAYTAKVTNDAFTVPANSRMLLSFYVKTSEIRSGKTGASAILVDGENETEIAAFDSTTIAKIDVDDDNKDIQNGWVQCFFFVENDNDDERSFSLKLTYGPKNVASAKESDYCDGYAAFANFEVKALSRTEYGYASTGDRAVKASLTGTVDASSSFDAAAVTSNIEKDFAKPVNFNGVQSWTKNMTAESDRVNPTVTQLNESGLYTGLLNAKYAQAYRDTPWAAALGATSDDWWNKTFGDRALAGRVANQPLVILNTSNSTLPAYGYFAGTASVTANSYQKITMRVKLSQNAKAYVYLIDTSDVKKGFNDALAPVMPKVTYWYDDNGNICTKDPASKDFKAREHTAYYLESNGLYTKANADDGKYYANLSAYDTATDGSGNLVTANDTVAFYKNGDDYYAYYDKKTKKYSQIVTPLPTEGDIVRYAAPADMKQYENCIVVEGTDENAGKWVEVSFYLHTGTQAKSYRLEVWAGERTCKTDENGNWISGEGIPKNSYVMFDAYASSSASSDYENLLGDMVKATKDALNEGKNPGDEGYLGEDDNLPATHALYYAFTFYDSKNFVRYDESLDEDKLGNPFGSYKQSEHEELLVGFSYKDNGTLTGSPVNAKFVDYSAYDVDVPEDDLGGNDKDDDKDDSTPSNTNFWLLLSSGILVGALVFAIGAVIVRRIVKNRKKNAANKPIKQKAPKLKIVKSEEEPEEPEEAPAEDENDPYHD